MSKLAPVLVEYIWIDGSVPTQRLRSKTRCIPLSDSPELKDFPQWSFDGSSTMQATGNDSDCLLEPVYFVSDPTHDGRGYLVLCEVQNPDGSDHLSNARAQLRTILDKGGADHDPWLGFEQEYTMFEGERPLGWPEYGYPEPQGPYYCGVGPKQILGRDLVMDHANACMDAGLLYYGLNAEVMPGQWEFQIGYRGLDEDVGALTVCDHMILSRWILHRLSEHYGIHVSFENKPIKGDWNGAGMHTNFSTSAMRDPKTGQKTIDDAVKRLEPLHDKHIALYGHGLSDRLTGDHETADINTFSAGSADRGCSIRIPRQVASKGYGYIEDRRPGANADPYLVASRLITTICNLDDKLMSFDRWPRKKAA